VSASRTRGLADGLVDAWLAVWRWPGQIVSKGTAQKRDTKVTLVGLYSPQCVLMESFITSALDQLDEDARALRALRNLQRRKSITEVGPTAARSMWCGWCSASH